MQGEFCLCHLQMQYFKSYLDPRPQDVTMSMIYFSLWQIAHWINGFQFLLNYKNILIKLIKVAHFSLAVQHFESIKCNKISAPHDSSAFKKKTIKHVKDLQHIIICAHEYTGDIDSSATFQAAQSIPDYLTVVGALDLNIRRLNKMKKRFVCFNSASDSQKWAPFHPLPISFRPSISEWGWDDKMWQDLLICVAYIRETRVQRSISLENNSVFRVVFLWEETRVPTGNQPVQLGDRMPMSHANTRYHMWVTAVRV